MEYYFMEETAMIFFQITFEKELDLKYAIIEGDIHQKKFKKIENGTFENILYQFLIHNTDLFLE